MVKESFMKRAINRKSFSPTCQPSDTGTSHQVLHKTIWQHLSIVMLLLLSMGVGFGTTTAQAQTFAYVTNACLTPSPSILWLRPFLLELVLLG